MTFTLTREQLYDLVWSEPMLRLAKQIGISDVAIAKHCRKLGVPVPERGYWNKLHAGKSVTKAELPERDLVTINRITMSGTLSSELLERLKGKPGMPNEQSECIELLTERLRKRLGTVTVPRNFSRLHPAIAAILNKDEKLRQEYALRPYSWNQPRFETPFERRRLLFLNGLFLGFAQVGGAGWLRGPDTRELSIYMGDASVSFQLEKAENGKNRRRLPSSIAKAPEALCLTISHHNVPSGVVVHWRDQEGCPLESQLTEVIIGMTVAGQHLHRQWMEQQAAWERERRQEAERTARERKEEEERLERERLAAIEKAKIDRLIRDADAWRNAKNIREYIAAARLAAERQANAGELEPWLCWALAEADKLDPIVSGRAIETIKSEVGLPT